MRNPLRLSHLYILEAGLIGWFFISSLRYVIGMLYSRIGSASVLAGLDPTAATTGAAGVVSITTFQNEILLLGYALALPLLTILVGRFRPLLLIGVLLAASGRLLLVSEVAITSLSAAIIALSGGLLYLSLLVRWRAQALPYFFVIGLAADQIARAGGNTLDPTWAPSFQLIQVALSGAGVLLGLVTLLRRPKEMATEGEVRLDYGLLPVWGGIGLGALLFLQLSLLALPNAVAGRSSFDYTNLAPLVFLATVLPLVPAVRVSAGRFISLFDRSARGWLWMVLLVLLLVFGARFSGLVGAIALVLAQLLAALLWWWVVRLRAEREFQLTGLWLVLGMLILFLLAVADNFTYEYAFVQNMPPDLAFLDPYVPPFLLAFRGLGLAVLLLGAFLASLPVVYSQRRIPWLGATRLQTLAMMILVAATTILIAYLVRPPVVQALRSSEQAPLTSLRIGTYNIHTGFSQFFSFDMNALAETIQASGASVILLQEAEVGRLTSFGVDQPLWLARRLGLDRRFFPTNEGLHGLAVLSQVPIIQASGVLLPSEGTQTGLQRVTIQPDGGIVTLYNTGLDYLLDTGDSRTLEDQEQGQQRQLEQIFQQISLDFSDGNPGRMILGGTFNNTPSSPLGQRLRSAGFVDPFAGLPIELSATLYRVGLPNVQFDYLWVWRRSLLPLGVGVMDSDASDHRMAVAELLLNPQGN